MDIIVRNLGYIYHINENHELQHSLRFGQMMFLTSTKRYLVLDGNLRVKFWLRIYVNYNDTQLSCQIIENKELKEYKILSGKQL